MLSMKIYINIYYLSHNILTYHYKVIKMDNELLNEIHMVKNHSKGTKKLYKFAVDRYTEYNSMTLEELLEEAEIEEEQGIRWKKRKLKRRLIGFRQCLLENYCLNTVKSIFHPIMHIYKYYEIEIMDLPKINKKGVKTTEPVTFKDLPDKEVIRNAIKISNTTMTAVILFMASSGCARRETLNLTIQDYIDALSEYSNKSNIYDIIRDLGPDCNVVPTFKILRQKTDKYYTTYCSPEAVNAINLHILSRKEMVSGDSPLFKIDDFYFLQKFIDINNSLGLGKVGAFNRFRSHMLRKFHASALYNDGMSLDKVNDLQGKSKNTTDASYFMTNPEDLKYEYIKHLPAVTIMQDVEKLSIKSPEYMAMENENNELKTELNSIKSEISDLTGIREEISEIKSLKEELLHLKNDS